MVKVSLLDGCYYQRMSPIKIIFIVFTSTFSITSFCAKIVGDYNNPKYFLPDGAKYITNLDELPKTATLIDSALPNPVVSTHWLYKFGGISYRYQTNEIDYPILKKKDLDYIDIDLLSPSEKYDIAVGDYNFSLTRNQKALSIYLKDDETAGHCHGWAQFATWVNFRNKVITLTNPDGFEVKFYPQDRVAIRSYFESDYMGNTDLGILLAINQNKKNILNVPLESILDGFQNVEIQNRFRNLEKEQSSQEILKKTAHQFLQKYPNISNTKFYFTPYLGYKKLNQKMNAGAFHLTITNALSNKVKLIADVNSSNIVWNRPILQFQSRYEDVNKSKIKIQIQVTYLKEIEEPEKYLPNYINHTVTFSYEYYLELDDKRNIIGGEWITPETERPEFIWTSSMASYQNWGKQKFFNKVYWDINH